MNEVDRFLCGICKHRVIPKVTWIICKARGHENFKMAPEKCKLFQRCKGVKPKKVKRCQHEQ